MIDTLLVDYAYEVNPLMFVMTKLIDKTIEL